MVSVRRVVNRSLPPDGAIFISSLKKGTEDMRMTKEILAPLIADRKVSVESIAKKYGFTTNAIYEMARKWELKRPSREKDGEDDCPSPQEIKDRAAEIRRGWTPEQRASRYVGPRKQRYRIPCYETAELTGAADLPCYARL